MTRILVNGRDIGLHKAMGIARRAKANDIAHGTGNSGGWAG